MCLGGITCSQKQSRKFYGHLACKIFVLAFFDNCKALAILKPNFHKGSCYIMVSLVSIVEMVDFVDMEFVFN